MVSQEFEEAVQRWQGSRTAEQFTRGNELAVREFPDYVYSGAIAEIADDIDRDSALDEEQWIFSLIYAYIDMLRSIPQRDPVVEAHGLYVLLAERGLLDF